MTNFTIGQKVRVKAAREESGFYHEYKKGEIVEILEQSSSGNCLCKNDEGKIQYIQPSNLELVAQAFKSGDKVKLISGGNRYPLHGFTNGNEYEVTAAPDAHKHHSGKNLFQITGGTGFGGERGFASAAQLLASPSPIAKFKAGDKAVLTSVDTITLNGFASGDVVTVEEVTHNGREFRNTVTKGPEVGYASESQLELKIGEEVTAKDLKVGDVIVLVDEDGVLPSWWTAGKEYKIVNIDQYGDPRVIDDEGDEMDVPEHDDVQILRVIPAAAEPVEYSKSIAKFGDIIQLTKRRSCLTVGRNYTVIEIDYDGDAQILDDDGDELDLCAEHEMFVLVSRKKDAPAAISIAPTAPAKAEFTSRPTVGDKVKITAHDSGHDFEIGDIVEIITDAKDDHPYQGKRVSDGYAPDANWLKKSEIELLDLPQFKVGDVIRGTDAASSRYGITTKDMTRAEVVAVSGTRMSIKVLDHSSRSAIGDEYDVKMEYFELVPAEATQGTAPSKLMFLATKDGADITDGRLYEIHYDEDGDLSITDDVKDSQCVDVPSEGKLVNVTITNA